MKKKKAATKRKAGKRKAKPGKYAGRSLIVIGPPAAENQSSMGEALANAERHYAAVLAREPAQSAAKLAARRLDAIRNCRIALAAGNAEGAAWNAFALGTGIGHDNLDGFAEPILRDKANTDALSELSRRSKKRRGYVEAADYAVQKYGAAMKPGQVWDALKAAGRKHVNGRIVEVIDGGKRISCTPHAPITREVFLRTYLAPARMANR